jgi:hypothetical protein
MNDLSKTLIGCDLNDEMMTREGQKKAVRKINSEKI